MMGFETPLFEKAKENSVKDIFQLILSHTDRCWEVSLFCQ